MSHLSVASVWISAVIQSFEARGLDVGGIVSGLPGFEDGIFSGQTRIDLLSVRRLWHRADRQARDPLLGLKVGMAHDVRSLGVLAPLLWHSPTLRAVMLHAARFQSLISENGAFRYEPIDGDGRLRCVYEETPSILPSNPQQVLSIVTTIIVAFREVSARPAAIDNLEVPGTMPGRQLGAALNLNVRNRGAAFSFEIDTGRFDEPIQGRDDQLYQLCLEYAQRLIQARTSGDELIVETRRFIANHGLSAASIEDYASQCGTSSRYLQRKLAEQGTSFRGLKEEVLREESIKALGEGLTVPDTASRLGYSEASAFYRAFKAWFGSPPREIMQQYRDHVTLSVDVERSERTN